jgi:anti-sigma-K factor RskA
VTGCEAYGELIAGYVMGALDPEEVEAVRHHLTTCGACAREHAALAGLPALLDRIEPTDVPPPLPPPAVEEAVLDTWARERRRSRTTGRTRRAAPWRGERHPEPAATPRRGTRRGARGFTARWWRTAAAVAGALAAVAIALAIVLPDGDDPYARGTLRPTATSTTSAWGSFTVEAAPGGTRVYLQAKRLQGDRSYEVWCVRGDGRWISGGSFRPGVDGRATATLTAAVRPGEYHEVVVTGRASEGQRGDEILRGKLVY